MKRVLVSVLLLFVAGGLIGAFAEGQTEDPAARFGPQGRYNGQPAREEVTLTGRVYFEGLDFPVLKTADEEYTLMVPRFYTFDFEIEEGETITVEGLLGPQEMQGRFSRVEEGDLHIMVTKAIVKGEEFEIGTPNGNMMSGDFEHRGMRGGRPMGRSSQNAPRGGRW